jgi:predicted O-methyltransferase YrrM
VTRLWSLVAVVLLIELAVGTWAFLYARERYRRLMMRFDGLHGFVWDTLNLVTSLRPRVPLRRPGHWAVSADFLIEISQRIIEDEPELVVELGSGLSTVVTALLLKHRGRGRMISIDHEAAFAATTRCDLAANDLTAFVEVRVAPLLETRAFGGTRLWYDTQVLTDLTDIDLLVVDGPPMPIAPDIRYPSLAFFWDRLRPGACVLLDDADREGERTILERWRAEFPDMESHHLDLEKGAVLLRKPRRRESLSPRIA